MQRRDFKFPGGVLVHVIRFLRVHPAKVDRLRAWFQELQSRRSEVLATFRQEGTRWESVHLLRGDDGPVLAYVGEVDDLDQARRAFAESTLPIDIEHKAVMASCLDGRATTEVLFECSVASCEGGQARETEGQDQGKD